MKMLKLYVCDNFMPEYQEVLRLEGFDDVVLKPFPCTCINRAKLPGLKEVFSGVDSIDHDGLIICGDHCNILKVAAQQNVHYRIHTSNYCYKNLVNENLIEYILEKGGYIISLGWLNHWQDNIHAAGFDRETARRFYHDFCQELVYFDAGIDTEATEKNGGPICLSATPL